MSDKFTPFVTVIEADWLNQVDDLLLNGPYGPAIDSAWTQQVNDLLADAPYQQPIDTTLLTNTEVVVTQIPSFAGIQALIAPINWLITLGYTTPGDGGGGLYVYDPNATEPDDGFLIIENFNFPGRYKLQHSGQVKVEQGGIKGGGVINNGELTNKVVQIAAKNGIELVWGSTTYIVDRTIYPDARFVWNCHNTTLLFDTSVEDNYHIIRRRDNAYEILSDGINSVIMRVALDLRNATGSEISGKLNLIGSYLGNYKLASRLLVPKWLVGITASSANVDPTKTDITPLAMTNGGGAESDFDNILVSGMGAGAFYHANGQVPKTWDTGQVYELDQCIYGPPGHSGFYRSTIKHTSSTFDTDVANGLLAAWVGNCNRALPWTRTRFRQLTVQFCLIPFRSGQDGASFDDCWVDILRLQRCGHLQGDFGHALISGTDLNIGSAFIYGLNSTQDIESWTCTTTGGSKTVTVSQDVSSLIRVGDTIALGSISGDIDTWPDRNYLRTTGNFFVSDVESITGNSITFKDVVPHSATNCKVLVNPTRLRLGSNINVIHWFQEGIFNVVLVSGQFKCSDYKVSTGEYASQLGAGLICNYPGALVEINLNADAIRSYYLKRVVAIVMFSLDGVDMIANVRATTNIALKLPIVAGLIDYNLSKWATATSYTTGTSVIEYAGVKWTCAVTHTSTEFWADLNLGRWIFGGVPDYYGSQVKDNRCLFVEYVTSENHLRPGLDASTRVMTPQGLVRIEAADGIHTLRAVLGQTITTITSAAGYLNELRSNGGRIYSGYVSRTGGSNIAAGATSTIFSVADMSGWRSIIVSARGTTTTSYTCQQMAMVNIANDGSTGIVYPINLVPVANNFEFVNVNGALGLKNNHTAAQNAIVTALRIY